MKVIEDRKKSWRLKIACTDCKSELEIEAGDIYYECLGCFDEFSTYYRAKCGACGQTIDLTKRVLPAWVRNQAKKG